MLSVDQIRAERARRHFSSFVQTVWPLVEPTCELEWGWHHDAVCAHLEAVLAAHIKRLVINIPPRSTKSTIVSVCFPVWCWLHDNSLQFITGSHAMPLATRDAVATRRLIEHPRFREMFGTGLQFTSDQNTKTRYDLKGGGHRIVFGMNSGVTGEGGDILLIDDPHPAKDGMWSAVNRHQVSSAFDHELCTRLNDRHSSAIVIVMQRLHADDLTGHVLAQGDWQHLCFPAEFDPSRPCRTSLPKNGQKPDDDGLYLWDQRTVEGEPLQTDRFATGTLAELRRVLGPYGYSGQYQQRPTPPDSGMLPQSWWKRWDTLPARLDQVIVSVDANFKRTDSGSYVVAQLWGAAGSSRFLIDQIRDRWDFTDTLRELAEFIARAPHRPDVILIEDKANGSAIISSLSRHLPNVVPYNPRSDSKEARAAAVAPQIQSGHVFLPDRLAASWVDDFITECTDFPRGSHDDQVDAMSQALDYMLSEAMESDNISPEALLAGYSGSVWAAIENEDDEGDE